MSGTSDEEFTLGTLSNYLDYCISYKKLTNEFYLLTNRAYKVKKDTLIPDGNKIELLLVMVDPLSDNIIGEAIIYKKLKIIEAFIIDSRYRRNGFGERFINFCISKFHIDNIEVLTNNKPAIKLYKKCGFEIYKKDILGKSESYKMKLKTSTSNLADTLESYLIPAEEGLLFSESKEINISKLGEKKTLAVFTTDHTLPFGGINYKKYMKDYNFNKSLSFSLDEYVDYKLSYIEKPSTMDSKLLNVLDNSNVSWDENQTIGNAMSGIFQVCNEYSKNNNTLIVITIEDTEVFSDSWIREYPIVIVKASIVASVTRRLTSSNSTSIKRLKYLYKDFERFNTKIAKSLVVKDMKFDLYHISLNGKIKELTPRITTKPLRTENMGIARISAAPSVDGCFRAIIDAYIDSAEKRKYYVYKLRLNKSTRIVKPNEKLVPDQKDTDEYWVLDPVPVDLIGSIAVSLDIKTNTILFDTSDMPEDSN